MEEKLILNGINISSSMMRAYSLVVLELIAASMAFKCDIVVDNSFKLKYILPQIVSAAVEYES